jgi:hypothetical protein
MSPRYRYTGLQELRFICSALRTCSYRYSSERAHKTTESKYLDNQELSSHPDGTHCALQIRRMAVRLTFMSFMLIINNKN